MIVLGEHEGRPIVVDLVTTRNGVRTLGIDLAAAPDRTAICTITWADGRAYAEVDNDALSNAYLVSQMLKVDKVGIDCPVGWPIPFVDAVWSQSHFGPWPPTSGSSKADRRALAFRRTDVVAHNFVGIWPLSVSTDRIGITAMRCAALLDALAKYGIEIDRVGSGLVAEVYPAASLKRWQLLYRAYKGRARVPALGANLDLLLGKMPSLELVANTDEVCRTSDDAFDALVSALIARAVMQGKTPLPEPEDVPLAAREGWIHIADCELDELSG